MIDGHGDDMYRYGNAVKSNFSSNIYSAVDHYGLIEHLAAFSKCGALTRYPEPEPRTLESKIASIHGIDSENVIVTNGVTEAIYLIASTLRGSCSAIVAPTFSEYHDACSLQGVSTVYLLSIDSIPPDVDSVWLCNPCNPTGRVTDKSRLLGIVRSNRDKLFIIDQAYADYTSEPLLSPMESVAEGNVILLSSLTKRYAIPGLRVGYAIGGRGVVDALRRERMPWSVNSLAIEAASYLFDHSDDYVIDARALHSEALRIAMEFRRLGITVGDTDCNFILCRLSDGRTAEELKEYLVREYGILIRNASNFHGLDGRFFRVAAQSPNENDVLIEAVKQWII